MCQTRRRYHCTSRGYIRCHARSAHKKTVLALQEGDGESTMSMDNQINISVQNDSSEIRNIDVSLSNNLEVEIKEQMNVQICQEKMRLAQNRFSA